jgi:3-hydroxybutyryl-CoA dehydrogenase
MISSDSSGFKIRTIGVVGCGLMGSGIAQVCAQAGYPTIVREIDQAAVENGLSRIDRFLAEGVKRKKLTLDTQEQTMAALSGTTELEALSECDLVIEAVVEDLAIKRELLIALDGCVRRDAIFASNTSSLCITEMASVTTRPNRFLGLHFFSPVPVMSMVEVVKGLTTSDETYQIGIGFIQSIGKTAVSAPDQPGFIVNRLLIPYLLHAIRTYEAGLGTVDDIDKSMTLGCGHPMGPFELLDFVGLDTTYYIAQIMHDEFHDPSYSPPPLLKRMVLAGRLGRKSGRGFHIYS